VNTTLKPNNDLRRHLRLARGRSEFRRVVQVVDLHSLNPRKAVRWMVGEADPLQVMATHRRAHPGWDPDFALARRRLYEQARAVAMKPADLPIDDGHLLVTPETAAFFNALARAA
jgi:hypothetical protein